jgi:PIN domain nuclease of toxin-antitoxin system
LILDTHVLLWILQRDLRISPEQIENLMQSENDIFISAVSAYEIVNKHSIGKLPGVESLVNTFGMLTQTLSYKPLSISIEHAHFAAKLEGPHKDPFDRLLAAQSIVEDMPIMTTDVQIAKFGAKVFW